MNSKDGTGELPLNIERRLSAAEEQTEQQKTRFLDVLAKNLGIVKQACAATGVGRTTHYRWMKEDPVYKEAVEMIAEDAVDFGTSKLFELMNGVSVMRDSGKYDENGDPIQERVYSRPPCSSSVQFFLRTKGRKAGFGDTPVIVATRTDVIDPVSKEQLPDWITSPEQPKQQSE